MKQSGLVSRMRFRSERDVFLLDGSKPIWIALDASPTEDPDRPLIDALLICENNAGWTARFISLPGDFPDLSKLQWKPSGYSASLIKMLKRAFEGNEADGQN